MDIRLPNGKIVKGIPEGTPKEVIKAKLISSGIATAEDFQIAPEAPKQAKPTLDIPEWKLRELRDNFTIDMPESESEFDEKVLANHYGAQDGVEYNNPSDTLGRMKADTGMEDFKSGLEYVRGVNTLSKITLPEDVSNEAINKGWVAPEPEAYVTKASPKDYLKSFAKSFEKVASDVAVTTYDIGTKPELVDTTKPQFMQFFQAEMIRKMGGMPVYSQEEYERVSAVRPETRELIKEKMASVMPEEWEEAYNRLSEDLASDELNWFSQGLGLIASQGGNLASGRLNPIVGYAAMASSERESMLQEMMNAGFSYEESQDWATMYGATSGVIEYLEMAGRLKGAGLGKKPIEMATKNIHKMLGRMLKEAGLNIAEELSQAELMTLIFNTAANKHNEANPSKLIKLRKQFDIAEMKKTAKDSGIMSVMLDAVGLGAKGAKTVQEVKKIKKGKAKLVDDLHLPTKIADKVKSSLEKVTTPKELETWYSKVMNEVSKSGLDPMAIMPSENGYTPVELVNAWMSTNKDGRARIKKAMRDGGDAIDIVINDITTFEETWNGEVIGKKHIGDDGILKNFVNEIVKVEDETVLLTSLKPMTSGQWKALGETRPDLVRAMQMIDPQNTRVISEAVQGNPEAQTLINDLAKTQRLHRKVEKEGYAGLTGEEQQLILDDQFNRRENIPDEYKTFEDTDQVDLDNMTNVELTKAARKKLESAEVWGGRVRGVAKHFVSLSTRISEISPRIGLKVRNARMRTHTLENEYNKTFEPFINKYLDVQKKIGKNDAEQMKFRSEVLNGDWEALTNRGFSPSEIKGMIDVFANIAKNMDLPANKNYFPRSVSDYNKLVEHYEKTPTNPIQKKLDKKAKEKGRALTVKERNTIVRDYLLISLRAPAVMERKIKTVTPEIAEFYDDPLVTLSLYTSKMSREIARKEYLNIEEVNKDFNRLVIMNDLSIQPDPIMDETIVNFIRKEVESDALDGQQIKELASLLKSDLTQQATPKIVRGFHKLVSLKYVSGPTTWISQFGDLFATLGEADIHLLNYLKNKTKSEFESGLTVEQRARKAVTALGLDWDTLSQKERDIMLDASKKAQSKVTETPTLESIGVDKLDSELQSVQDTIMSKGFKYIFKPLQYFDSMNKNILLQSTALKWQTLAMTDPARLAVILDKKIKLPEFNKKVIMDLQKKRLTPEVQLALYSQMADFHPINHSEHVKLYIDNPWLRPLFILRSFALKRFDRAYREAISQFIDGFVKRRKAMILKSEGYDVSALTKEYKNDLKFGRIGLAKFMFLVFIGDALMNIIKAAIKDKLGDEDREDVMESWDDVVPAFGEEYMSQILEVFPLVNTYALEKAIERKDLWTYMEAFEIPKPLGADAFKSIMSGGESDDWEKDIPIVGEYIDGIENAADNFLDSIQEAIDSL